MQQIDITPTDDGVLIKFPKDRGLIDNLRATFPKARWNAHDKVWYVPGKRALARVERWSEAHLAPVLRQMQQAERDADFEPLKASVYIKQALRRIEITTRYDQRASCR